jgi:hypothetical protein
MFVRRRAPTFSRQSAPTDGGEICQPYATAPFAPRKILGTHFC